MNHVFLSFTVFPSPTISMTFREKETLTTVETFFSFTAVLFPDYSITTQISLFLSLCSTFATVFVDVQNYILFLLSLLRLFVDCFADCNNKVIKVLLKSVSKNRRTEDEGNEWDELLSFCFGSFR